MVREFPTQVVGAKNPALSPISCVTLGNLLNLPVLHFPCL